LPIRTHQLKEIPMKTMTIGAVLAVVLALGGMTAPAQAKGCIKGAIVGGIAGHLAGHHGLIGAGAGCAIGHHEANKHAHSRTKESR
jgi:hypothetical protein